MMAQFGRGEERIIECHFVAIDLNAREVEQWLGRAAQG